VRLTFDTNVLVYAADRASERHRVASGFIARAAKADCVQTLQSFAECFHVLRRKRRVSDEEARAIIRSFRIIFPVAAAEPGDLDDAIAVTLRHQMHFWDAFLWATAKRNGCRMILTEDGQDGFVLDGVLFIDPFKARTRI
jgi:predicted nucleic acid-binding protein